MKLPAKIATLGHPIKVKEGKLKGKLGQWDEPKGVITIEKDQPKAGKLVTLAHEALHVVETMMIQNKLIKKRIKHEFISGAAFGVVAILAGVGAIKGIKLADLMNLEEAD
jgi:hypothetical protein